MSERKLATIQRIVKLELIPNADQIEKAIILGWELITKKGEFQVGDLCVYVEIDSQLPERVEFEFLRNRKFRIKTIKLKNQISQGIAFPLSILPNYLEIDYKEGEDVTELLGITKYDPQLQEENSQNIQHQPKNKFEKFLMKFSWYRKLFLKQKTRNWPKFISKTDEDRIQLFPHICENEQDTIFQISEKLDGSSATFALRRNPKRWQYWNKFEFYVCSRNIHKKREDDSSYWQVAKKYDIENKLLKAYNKLNRMQLVIQGEILGPKIQSNKYKIYEYQFFVYNIKDLKDNKIFTNKEIYTLCDYLELKTVPFLDNNFKLKSSIPEMVEYAKGKSQIADIQREGIVIRNYEKNISFKIINPNFLLKYEE
jgi:hypothetical protein